MHNRLKVAVELGEPGSAYDQYDGHDPFQGAVDCLKRIAAIHGEIQDVKSKVTEIIGMVENLKGKAIGREGESPEPKQSAVAGFPVKGDKYEGQK